jgi:release factor glutamine methyltransferase
MNLSPAELYAQSKQPLTNENVKLLERYILRRLNNEPTAYITGNKEFYGIDFYVDFRVLIPRPETELLIDECIRLVTNCGDHLSSSRRPMRIADIGTGSGVLAICLAIHIPNAIFYATDISSDALEVAFFNSSRHRVSDRITFLKGNLMEPLPDIVDVVVANLPYVSAEEMAQLGPHIVDHEPNLALAAGQTGLDYIEAILAQAEGRVASNGYLLLEIGHDHSKPVTNLIHHYLPKSDFQFIEDLNGMDRVVSINIKRN